MLPLKITRLLPWIETCHLYQRRQRSLFRRRNTWNFAKVKLDFCFCKNFHKLQRSTDAVHHWIWQWMWISSVSCIINVGCITVCRRFDIGWNRIENMNFSWNVREHSKEHLYSRHLLETEFVTPTMCDSHEIRLAILPRFLAPSSSSVINGNYNCRSKNSHVRFLKTGWRSLSFFFVSLSFLRVVFIFNRSVEESFWRHIYRKLASNI